MKPPRPIFNLARKLALLLFSLVGGVVLLEVVGQNFLFKEQLYFAHNIDHRIPPGSAPDINADGLRCRREANDFPAAGFNVVMLGDSFIFGAGLEYEASIPCRFESLARAAYPDRDIRVANFAWVSASPLLSHRLLRDIGRKYRPDLVLLAVDMTDFCDDIKYQKLLAGKGIYRFLRVTPISILAASKAMRSVGFLRPLHEAVFQFPGDKFFATAQPLAETLPYFEIVRSNIADIARFCRTELHCPFLLFLLPRNYQYSAVESPDSWEKDAYEILGPYCHEPFRYFEGIRDEVDFPIFSLLPDFQQTTVFPTCFPDDPHWNEQGARVAAEAMLGYCHAEGYFD